jgi:hypothetical protein
MECVRVLGDHADPVSALVVDENLVVSGSNVTVRLWDLDELCPRRWDTYYALSFQTPSWSTRQPTFG